MEPLGVSNQIIDIWSIKTWYETEQSSPTPRPPHPVPNHEVPPFKNFKDINRKICLW